MGQLQSTLLPSAIPAYVRITREQLTELVSDLNKRCDACFAESSVKLFFAVKGLDEKAIFWKKSVQIKCFTMRMGTSYSKTYSLFEFMRFYRSLLPILEAAEASSSSPQQQQQQAGDLANNEQLMQMSVFQESCSCDGQCIICFEEKPNVILPCMHAYCEKCVGAFRGANQTTCPLCRHKLTNGTEKECWVVEEKPDKETMCAYMVGGNGGTNSEVASTSTSAATKSVE